MNTNRIQLLGAGIAIGLAGALALNSFFAQPETALAINMLEEQPEGAEGMGEMQDMQAMMDEWMDSINPGPNHEMLEHFVGSWNITTRVWFGGPGTPAMESTGTSEVKWVLGNRFLLEEMDSTFPMPGENGEVQNMPMSGIGMTGYDNFRNMYVQTWADNFTTTIHKMWGSSMDGKVFTFYGEMDEPMMNVIGRTIKSRITIKDANTHVFEMFDTYVSDDYKVFEFEYTRKQ